MSWKPRASALGHYASCLYRAAFDRALAEQALELPAEVATEIEEKKRSSPYADLGTCIHYHLQAGIGATFPAGDHAPTQEQLINASELFGKDLERTKLAVRNSAIMASQHLPKLPDGEVWEAEVETRTRYVNGHIDLLNRNAGIIVDLKTTSRPPLHPTIKPAHLIQLLTYVDGIEQAAGSPEIPVLKTAMILYVDAQGASWALPISVDLHSEGMIEYRLQARELAKLCASKSLYKVAFPNVGETCNEWCPYTSICRDKYRSPAGEVVRATGPKLKGPLG